MCFYRLIESSYILLPVVPSTKMSQILIFHLVWQNATFKTEQKDMYTQIWTHHSTVLPMGIIVLMQKITWVVQVFYIVFSQYPSRLVRICVDGYIWFISNAYGIQNRFLLQSIFINYIWFLPAIEVCPIFFFLVDISYVFLWKNEITSDWIFGHI